MRLLLVAPPGAGKGTQAAKLADHYGITNLSSGELVRKEIAADSEIGRKAIAYVRRGDLVPDDLIFQVLAQPLLEATRSGGYVLDGFPRNLHQAEAAYRAAREVPSVELQAVVHLDVPLAELTRRLLARGGQGGRIDDAENVATHRLEVFAAETEPLLGFYRARGLVLDIDGDQPVDKVFSDIVRDLDREHLGSRQLILGPRTSGRTRPPERPVTSTRATDGGDTNGRRSHSTRRDDPGGRGLGAARPPGHHQPGRHPTGDLYLRRLGRGRDRRRPPCRSREATEHPARPSGDAVCRVRRPLRRIQSLRGDQRDRPRRGRRGRTRAPTHH